jgi:hypothetical protein
MAQPRPRDSDYGGGTSAANIMRRIAGFLCMSACVLSPKLW